jgi:adenylate kinase family enzyme
VVKDYLVLVERIKSRAIKESRLDDSKEEVIYKRLGIYNQDTSAVLSKYSSNLVLKIDGLPSIKKIHKDIVSKLE